MLNFLEKKLEKTLEAPPPNPHWPPAAGGVVTSINCYSYFLQSVYYSADVVTVINELRNSNNVLLLPLVSYFKLCAGYSSYATASDFSASKQLRLYYLIFE